MGGFYPADDPAARLRWSIIDALRQYGTAATELSHAFAALHHLQPVDLQALVAVISAEGAGPPLTPGRLREHLGLSSGGTSYVIDRLESAGHITRTRDHPTDNRVVHLRYTDQGIATGMAFFGPLGQQTEHIMDHFTAEHLAVIEQFLTAATDAMRQHTQSLTPRPPRQKPDLGQARARQT